MPLLDERQIDSMKKTLILAIPALLLVLSGCDTGSKGGTTSPTEITPERQAEIDAHLKEVEEAEKAHQAGG
jgi:hypothetical protein